MNIKAIVESLCKKFDTRDPFEIAARKNILVICEPLGTIRGYYNRVYRQRMIHLNSDITSGEAVYVCAHELGHALLHPDSNTPFLKRSTLYSVDRLENEANRFAAELLLPDGEFIPYLGYTIEQTASALMMREETVAYKFQTLKAASVR